MNKLKLSGEEITQWLSVNKNSYKKHILNNIGLILLLNELLTEDDICTIKSVKFYDAINDIHCPFEDIINDFYLLHLQSNDGTYCFSNDELMQLHYIYN